MGDFDLAKKDLERIKRESNGKFDDLKRLEGDNIRIQKEGYEDRVEDLEKKYRNVDGHRKEVQMRLEHAHVQWECKLRLFVKDSEDKNRHTNEQLKRMQ